MQQLPTSVKIGPIVYAVSEVPRMATEQVYGSLVRTESVIEIHPHMSLAMQELTLIHEIVHALLLQGGIRDQDEKLIDVMAHGIVGLLQDNRWLKE